MPHLLILYNPYYQSNVIESHLEILKNEGKVAFGKIKSKLNTQANNPLESFYASINQSHPLQLFLTDYASLFVALVTQISSTATANAPKYYQQNSLEVDHWFMIEDMRELVRNDFVRIRDDYLPNFTTPHNNNRTYALYGFNG